MNKSSIGKATLGVFVVLLLGFFMAFAEINSYNVDAWGFSSSGEIINNYYTVTTADANSSLFVGRTTFFDEMCGAIQQQFTAISGGQMLNSNGTISHPCVRGIYSSVTAGTGGFLTTHAASFVLQGQETYETVLSKKVLARNGTTMYVGFHDATNSNAPVDGVYLNVSPTGVVYGIVRANSALINKTATNITVNFTHLNWFKLVVAVRNTTFSEFYVYNSTGNDGTGNTNLLWNDSIRGLIPSNTSRDVGASVVIFANGTTTNLVELVGIDYTLVRLNRSLTR